jgi:hypothetical protein
MTATHKKEKNDSWWSFVDRRPSCRSRRTDGEIQNGCAGPNIKVWFQHRSALTSVLYHACCDFTTAATVGLTVDSAFLSTFTDVKSTCDEHAS